VPTVRVKVAVIVDEEGRWGAAGGHEWTYADWDWITQEEGIIGDCRRWLFIEADVPLPAAPSVLRGQVTEKNKERAG